MPLHNYENIGKVNALPIFLAIRKIFPPATVGLPGKITWFICKKIGMQLASDANVIGNVGVAALEKLLASPKYEGTWNEIDKIINDAGGVDKLTPEEGKAIDDKIANALDQLVVVGKLRNN